MQGVDWSRAPDESAAESARLDRSGNRYAAWPDETGAEGSRLSRQGNAYAHWPDETGAEAARLDRYETKARFLANASKVWAAEDAAANRAGLAQQHRAADAYRSELRQKGEDALRLSGGPRGGTGAAYGDASVWNMRDASAALRSRAPESTFGYGFGLGSRSVLDGVPITTEEKIGRGLGELWAGAKSSVYTMTGARSFDLAAAELKAGNYGFAALHSMQSVGEAGLTLLGLGVGSVRTSAAVMQFPGAEATAAARATYVGNAEVGAGRTLSTYTGDVYSPDFVGPVQWKYFYRGDATARTNFLSSIAQERGIRATTEFLDSHAGGTFSDIYAQHGVGSQGLPTIGVSDNRLVAEYFARGPSQTQNGFVTTFRMEAREAERLAIPNWDNPVSFTERNPLIGMPEREFLFHVQIDPKNVVKQVPVGPR